MCIFRMRRLVLVLEMAKILSLMSLQKDTLQRASTMIFRKITIRPYQLAGTVRTAANLEWDGSIGFKSEDYFFYGYQPTTLGIYKRPAAAAVSNVWWKIKPSQYGSHRIRTNL